MRRPFGPNSSSSTDHRPTARPAATVPRMGSVPPNQFAKLARQGFFANYAVMAQYGNTMLHVQSFEQALAALVAVVEHAAALRSARESGDARLFMEQSRAAAAAVDAADHASVPGGVREGTEKRT
jgi:hypothetical protein